MPNEDFLAEKFKEYNEEAEKAKLETQDPIIESEKKEPIVEEQIKEPVSGWNAEEFGGKSIDEVKQVFSKYPELESQVASLSQKATEYEEKLKEFEKPRSAYKNPTYYKLEQIEEKEPDHADVYKKFLFGNLNDMELFKAGFLLDNPEYKDNDKFVQRKLERAFPILFDPDADKESQEYEDAKMDLELEAKKVRKTLQAKLDSIEVPDPTKEQAANQAKQDQFVQSWKPLFDEITKNNKITIEVQSEKDGKKGEPLFDVEMSPEEAKEYYNKAAHYLISQGLQPGAESVNKINQFIQKLYVAEHFIEINTKIAEHVAKAEGKNWRKRTHNSQPPDGQKPIHETTTDPSRALTDELIRSRTS